jgi:hypothetical protein
MVFCAQCGTPGEGRFCSQCGARLNSATPSDSGASTLGEPPSYSNSYAGQSSEGARAAQIGGAAFSTGTSASVSSRGSTQPAPHSNVRGLAGTPIASGTSVGGTSAPAAIPQTALAGFVNQPPAIAPYQQQESPTALFGSQGYRLEAFFYITREIFVALDRTTQPVGTQMMEASKIRRFRELCGKAIPPYYETHVLPLYCESLLPASSPGH